MTLVRLGVGAIVLGAEALVVAQEAPSVCGPASAEASAARPATLRFLDRLMQVGYLVGSSCI